MAAKLKVFRYSDGFHAWTVAASSRAKALAAWGVKRDLFKDGSAEQIQDGADYDAALKAPGELIERGLAVDIGKVERTRAPKAPTRKGPSPRDKARVEALETQLAALDQTHAEAMTALDEKRQMLEREATALGERQDKARTALKAKLKAARAKVS